MTKSRNILGPRTVWTEAKLQLLRDLYPNRRAAEMADQLGIKLHIVYRKAVKLGLKKSAEFLASADACRLRRGDNVGAEFRFGKGHIPANKGLRQPGLAIGRMAETQFKKGRPASESSNYKPVGTYRVNRDGHLEQKVTDDPTIYPARRWRPVYRLVWEEANGPIPKGHLVRFKPGTATVDVDQITVDKLECVTRVQHMKDHTFHQYGPEIAKLVQLRGALSRQINKREKNQ
jgi:hypothetical protein